MGSAPVRVVVPERSRRVRGFILGGGVEFRMFSVLPFAYAQGTTRVKAVLFGGRWGGKAFKLAKGINPGLVPVRPQETAERSSQPESSQRL